MKRQVWILAGLASFAVGGGIISNAPVHMLEKEKQEPCVDTHRAVSTEESNYWFNKNPKTGKVIGPPFQVCFSDNNDPGKIESFHAAMNAALWDSQEYFNIGARWGIGGFGTPQQVTWSFVPDGLTITPAGSWDNGNSAGPSSLFSTMDSQFASTGGRTRWIAAMQSIFDRWAAVSGIKFVRVKSGANDWDDGSSWLTGGNGTTRGDIRISMRNIDGASGSNILAYNYYPTTGDMVIDSSNTWTSGTTLRFLRNTLSHEIGHGLGFNHVCPGTGTKLMEPVNNTSYDGPQQDDIRNVHHGYGDIYEGNNTIGAVSGNAAVATISGPGTTTLGNLPIDSAAGSGFDPAGASTISLHSNGPDVDYYKITTTSRLAITVTARPIGTTYAQAAQDPGGSCPAGSNIDTLSIANLRLEVLNANQTSLIVADSFPAGSSESSGRMMLNPGTYYVKVDAATGVSETQLYKLDIVAGLPSEIRGRITVDSVSAFLPGETVTAILSAVGSSTPLETLTTALTSTGNYTFTPTLALGTYALRIKGPSALVVGFGSVTLVDGFITVNRTGLNGDANGDNEIGPSDFDIVVANFGTPSNLPSLGDFDRDGEVGPSDFDLVVRNYGFTGN